ncbi:MAG TPA: hypothetical protein DEA45_03790 [Acholeplasmataceae bacterium]|nr:hypothetical protein [Acholeplasmataceae bacterium]
MAPIIIGLISLWLFMNHYVVSGFLVWVLFLTPLGSLILKPKKHQVEYLTLIISLGYLMISQFTSHDINYGLITLMLFIIYVVFLLPII